MTTRLLASAFFAVALTLAGLARAEDEPPSPARMVSDLQSLQAAIAQGDKAAYAAQPGMFHDIAVAFVAAKPEVWKDQNNVHAAVAYLLSGGQPRVIGELLENGGMAKDDEALMRGALAYVLGREAEAEKLIGGLDPRTLDLRLGGQIAFVQSVLATSRDKKKAIELLDLARLLAPGGLVEEAALRREIFVAGDMRDVDRFALLSRQYVDRFPRSIYADNFMRGFASTVARLGLAEDLANFHKFDALTSALSAENRRALFLAIARAALLDGKTDVADVASQKVLLQAPPDSPEEARAKLYQGAARVVTDQHDVGLAEMQDVDVKKLAPRDIALLAAARGVAARLHQTPPITALAQPLPTDAAPRTDDAAAATIQLAEAAIARADSLLKDKPR